MKIWRIICPTCRTAIFQGNIPEQTAIYIQCLHCGDLWRAWGLPGSVPELIQKWERTIDV